MISPPEPRINPQRFQEITGLNPSHISEDWEYDGRNLYLTVIAPITRHQFHYLINETQNPNPWENR